MYVIGLNGPPQCGKDTLAMMIKQRIERLGLTIPVRIQPLSYPLREIAFKMVGKVYDPYYYEAFKETQFMEFGLKTGRELMIDISESFLKPLYGQSIMARMMFKGLAEDNFEGLVIVPDNGFTIEASYIHTLVGGDNYYVIRVRRDGCNFDKDSREWVRVTHDSDLDNDGTLADLELKAAKIVDRLVNDMRWAF